MVVSATPFQYENSSKMYEVEDSPAGADRGRKYNSNRIYCLKNALEMALTRDFLY
jgi:hypothetical protein